MTSPPQLDISVRALVFRAAQVFEGDTDGGQRRLRIEPLRGGGAVIVAAVGRDMIVVPDPTGEANRPATIVSPGALSKIAVDLFRRDSVPTRFNISGGTAWIDPDTGGSAKRNVELDEPFTDWRARLAPHASLQIRPPFVGDGRMGRRLSDVALNLARAAGRPDLDLWRLCGGFNGATLATFPVWPGAVALFADSEHRAAERAELRTDWMMPDWMAAPRLALVPGP